MIGERGAALSAEHAIKRLEKPQKEALAVGVVALRVVLDATTTSHRARKRRCST